MIDPVVTAELRWQREQDQQAAEDDGELLASDAAYLTWLDRVAYAFTTEGATTIDKHEKQMLDDYITREPDWLDEAAPVVPDPFPNRLSEQEADALGFRHLRHVLQFHGPATLDTESDEDGLTYSIEVKGDRDYGTDLLDLVTIGSVWLCQEHVDGCKDLGTEWGCEQHFCHEHVAYWANLGKPNAN